MDDLKQWTARARPSRTTLDGRYVTLEPLDAQRHGDGLYAASTGHGDAERFRFLFEAPPQDRDSFDTWIDVAARGDDPLFFAVIDNASGKVAGRQALMRIDQAHGVVEIGSIYWGSLVSRRPAATEALLLFANYAFDTLGYRRFEWKCNDRNEPSRRAAERFGFTYEGTFRQHMVQKGENRDTAWFSIVDREWPALRDSFEAWLSPGNFDADGQQIRSLRAFRPRSR